MGYEQIRNLRTFEDLVTYMLSAAGGVENPDFSIDANSPISAESSLYIDLTQNAPVNLDENHDNRISLLEIANHAPNLNLDVYSFNIAHYLDIFLNFSDEEIAIGGNRIPMPLRTIRQLEAIDHLRYYIRRNHGHENRDV
ncbi:MAG: hypothetical protein COS89_07925 [Deltaproteobacteria bacterium CG07_land_8_20_14_0_80_38_7]|nr:MAG: hypothetical protein COS89_07925 [Deltaproteobacteria bacterium CG07_land_8_20_14_0_80_38_7]